MGQDLKESLIDRLAALIGYLPIGLERLVHTAVGPTPRRLPVLLVTLVLLTALALLPVGQYLVDLIVRPVTVSEIVDRRVGLSTRLVAVDGLALLVPFVAAPPPTSGSVGDGYHWYAVRDSLQERRLVLVRSTISVESLQTRSVVARIVNDPSTVEGAREGIAQRGGVDPGAALAPRMLDEVDPAGHAISDVGSVAELGDRSVGDVVRIRLRITAGIASCVPRGDCVPRRLADGIGSWDNLAADPDGDGWVVLRTNYYPPSVAPFHGVGQHAGDLETVERFLAQPLVRGILGWGNVLRSAHVEHDLNLPIDRLWFGPVLFLAVVGVLLLGLRLGYPRFRVREIAGRWRVSDAPRQAAEIRCLASGRVTPPGRSPIEVDDAPAVLSAEPDGGSRLRMEVGDAGLDVAIPRQLGSLGMVEAGDIVLVGRRLPALRVGWFGSQVELVFTDAASRDAAAALVRHVG